MGWILLDGDVAYSLGNSSDNIARYLLDNEPGVAKDLMLWYMEADLEFEDIADGLYDGYTTLEWTIDALIDLMDYYWNNGNYEILQISEPNIYYDGEDGEIEHPSGYNPPKPLSMRSSNRAPSKRARAKKGKRKIARR
jgi:hypothetical protein